MDFDFTFSGTTFSVALSFSESLCAVVVRDCFVRSGIRILSERPLCPDRGNPQQVGQEKPGLIFAGSCVLSLLCPAGPIATVPRLKCRISVCEPFSAIRHLRMIIANATKRTWRLLQSSALNIRAKECCHVLGDVVIFVQQESLSNALDKPRKSTPQILRASATASYSIRYTGIRFRANEANECILCGVPPSIGGDLVDDYSAEEPDTSELPSEDIQSTWLSSNCFLTAETGTRESCASLNPSLREDPGRRYCAAG